MRNSFKVVFVFCMLSLIHLSVFGEWTNEERYAFRDAEEYCVIFDMNDTNYENMDSISFVEYYAAKNGTTSERFGTIVKYIGSELCKSLSNRAKKKFSLNSDSKYIVHIHLDEITGKGGMKVTVHNFITPNGETFTFTSSVNDGRWNKFDKLVEENCDKLAKTILKERDIPYRSVKLGNRNSFGSIYY